jgi:hypothetical protein
MRRVWAALAMLGVFAAASCQKKDGHDHSQETFDYEKPPEFDRALNQSEIDTMRAMKITHHVTRDEYWDLKGGVIANDRVEVWYANRKIYVLQAMAVLKQMDMMADEIQKAFGRIPEEKLVVVCAPDLKTFRTVTGLDWWHYGRIKSDTLSIQTPMTLFMRGLLHAAARREYCRWALGHFTGGRAPQWVLWGGSSYLAREREVLREMSREYMTKELRMSVEDINRNLAEESDRIETRRAMYNAYLMMNQLVETNGLPSVAAFILALGEEADPDAAAQRAFSKSYADVMAQAEQWKQPEPPSTAPAAPGHDHAR